MHVCVSSLYHYKALLIDVTRLLARRLDRGLSLLVLHPIYAVGCYNQNFDDFDTAGDLVGGRCGGSAG